MLFGEQKVDQSSELIFLHNNQPAFYQNRKKPVSNFSHKVGKFRETKYHQAAAEVE